MRYAFARSAHIMAVLATFADATIADAQRVPTVPRTSGTATSATATLNAASGIDNRRFPADSFWSRRWIRGGSDEPDRFVEPRQLVVTGGNIAVLDLGTREVSLLHAQTGAPLTTMTARGEGPGEFKRPAMLTALGSYFGVLDQATSRLSMFSATGTLIWDTPLSDAVMLEGMCMLPDASVLIKTLGADRSLRLVDSTGRVRWQRSLPSFRAGDETPPFASLGYLSGSIAGTRCGLVPQFGASWHTVDMRGNVQTFRFIEPGIAPTLKTSTTVLDKSGREELRRVVTTSSTPAIARGVLVIGDTVIVMAGSTKRSPYLLLDYYAVPSGRYLYSRKLFAAPTALTIASDGTFYGAFIGRDNSSVIAFAPSKVAPPPSPKTKRTDSTTPARSGSKPPPR